jgi:hypothetical protein
VTDVWISPWFLASHAANAQTRGVDTVESFGAHFEAEVTYRIAEDCCYGSRVQNEKNEDGYQEEGDKIKEKEGH